MAAVEKTEKPVPYLSREEAAIRGLVVEESCILGLISPKKARKRIAKIDAWFAAQQSTQ